jgi:predicted HTH domain antitoxin
MTRIVVEVPDNLAQELKRCRCDLAEILVLGLRQERRIKSALLEYQENRASIGRAAELAGLSLHEIIEQAVKHGVEPHWDEKMIREELGE